MYRAGNRSLEAEHAIARSRAPAGRAFETSLIET
jgi:hypothetical protein